MSGSDMVGFSLRPFETFFFGYSFRIVLLVKYKLKALIFFSFDLWGVARVYLT